MGHLEWLGARNDLVCFLVVVEHGNAIVVFCDADYFVGAFFGWVMLEA
jgi:hypothetical protein